jgi:DNA-binding transcriptional ArsR family regulator
VVIEKFFRRGLSYRHFTAIVNDMVKFKTPLDAIFVALADETRRGMLRQLRRGEATLGELAAPYPISLPAVMKHLDILRRAGLVRDRKEGRTRICELQAAPLAEAEDWIAEYREFWETRLDALEAYLTEDDDTHRKEKDHDEPN